MWADEELDLNRIENASSLAQAAAVIAEKSAAPDYTAQTDGQGKAEFADLKAGVYLVQALDDSGYDEITPFLVALPAWSEEEGKMLYEVTVNPKHTPRPEEEEQGRKAPQTGVSSPLILLFGASAAILGAGIMLNMPGGYRENDEAE